jgi:AcrR family transcriptional regulator
MSFSPLEIDALHFFDVYAVNIVSIIVYAVQLKCYTRRMNKLRSPRRTVRPAHRYHHGSLRKSALREAHRILATRGVDAVTVRAIARAVRVTPNALYRHFQDKDALLATVAEQGFRELCQGFRAIRAKDSRRCFREMARSYVRFGMANPAVLELMFGRKIAVAPKGSSLNHAAEEAFMELLQVAAEAAGIATGSKDSVQLAIACWSLMHGCTALLTRARSTLFSNAKESKTLSGSSNWIHGAGLASGGRKASGTSADLWRTTAMALVLAGYATLTEPVGNHLEIGSLIFCRIGNALIATSPEQRRTSLQIVAESPPTRQLPLDQQAAFPTGQARAQLPSRHICCDRRGCNGRSEILERAAPLIY